LILKISMFLKYWSFSGFMGIQLTSFRLLKIKLG
jgi:hypothetical protein